MQVLVCTCLLFASISAVEQKIPSSIYAKKSFCSGEDLRLSCAEDGVPFKDYSISLVGVEIFTTHLPMKSCLSTDEFPLDDDICAVDYHADTSEYSGLGFEIEAQCDSSKECFIRLPAKQDLTSSKVCNGDSRFHSVTVEFTCAEPGPERILEDSDKYEIEEEDGENFLEGVSLELLEENHETKETKHEVEVDVKISEPKSYIQPESFNGATVYKSLTFITFLGLFASFM